MLRRSALVAVMQAADMRNRDDRAVRWRHDRSRRRRILVEREVRARCQVVLDVGLQDAAQTARIADDDVIEALAADGTDQALGVCVLPR